MKLKTFTIDNFRAYREPKTIEISDLTTIIGRNDVGKSTILEAMEIFFNGEAVQMEQADANVFTGATTVTFTAEFTDLPDELPIDESAPTTLEGEYLVSSKGTLVIQKVYDCALKKPSSKTFIIAHHPTAEGAANLLELKEKDLQTAVRSMSLDVSLKGNPGMRRAIWDATPDLALGSVAIEVSKSKEDGKRIWEKLEAHLPIFALFQSDRSSRDSDEEVQNPMKMAIAAAIAEAKSEIEKIEKLVQAKAEEIAGLTHQALKTIDSRLADSLTPKFTPPTAAKWSGLFSLGMDTDNKVPLNKRGSGVRRLILVSFFKAEAERRMASSSRANIIYAIEEPETSQHPANQKTLVRAFEEIAATPNAQVILTTHSPGLAAELPVDSIRFIHSAEPFATPSINQGVDVFGDVADALGLTPDSRVKVLICVEGPTDVDALGHLSAALHAADPSIPNLLCDQRFAFVPLGGSTLKHWVAHRYLKDLRLVEAHLYDRDRPEYAPRVAEVNARDNGDWARQTQKYEIECYLHATAVREGAGVEIVLGNDPERSSVFPAFCEEYSRLRGYDKVIGDTKAKGVLAKYAFPKMTAALIAERDPQGEVASWFRQMVQMADGGGAQA